MPFLADDYSPFVSVQMYETFILPYQLQLRDAFTDTLDFHSCIPAKQLAEHWRDKLNIRLFNGFKPQGGLTTLKEDFQPIADVFAGRICMEPDLDGANTMSASAEQLQKATLDWLGVFGAHAGVKLCATLSGGHTADDLVKMNVLKQTVLEHATAARASD